MTSIAHTPNPYAVTVIPAIGRVLDALAQLASDLGQRTLQVSNRQVAQAAGLRSAGQIPTILRQLAHDGHISYDPATSLIMVISAVIDQDADQGASDQSIDRPIAPMASACPPATPPDQSIDRPYKEVGLMKSHEEEEGRARARTNEPPVVPLLRADNARPSVIARILAALPDLTPERYLVEKGWWQRLKAGTTIGYLFGVLMNGSTLTPGSEDSDAVRRARPTPRPAPLPAPDGEYDDSPYRRPRSRHSAPKPRFDLSEYADLLVAFAPAGEAAGV